LIISNHKNLEYIAERFDIPFYHLPITKDTKAEQEAKQLKLLKENGVDFIVLARYMQIITDDFIGYFPNQIINIHHSFLPAFIGAKPYHQAFERGVKIIGATSHYVTQELDAGPIITQDVAKITHKENVKDLITKGKDLEKLVLSKGIALHLQHKVLSYGNKTVIFN
jgi:formyltetrahydrofolate deformylase